MKKNACTCVDLVDASINEIKKLVGEEQARGLAAAWEDLRGDLVKFFNKPKKQKKPRGGKQALGKKLAKVVPAIKKEFTKAGVKASAKTAKMKPDKAVKQADATKRQPAVSLASVKLSDHEITLNLGGFPVRALAERDAKELLSHPKIFWYRQTMFPDPKAAKVQPTIMTATVSERNSPRFTRAPYTVRAVIHIDGDVAHCRAWAEGVVSRNKGDQE